jgi:glyoxylase-like metal-dependent hydrolase (beta-lactamase superfamily II)
MCFTRSIVWCLLLCLLFLQGNIMVDVPRWTPLLAQRLEQLGGVRWIFLTHRDDVSDHAQWAAHFGAERIIHRSEANQRQGTE